MPITYYPTSSNKKLPSGAAPYTYPGTPVAPPGSRSGPMSAAPEAHRAANLSIADLVFASILDVMEGVPYDPPVNLSWLFDLFNSALDDGPSRIRTRSYGQISRSWKRAISETVANATSIGIALFEEKFDWAVPVPLLKVKQQIPSWWPWHSYSFHVAPALTVPPAAPYPLMPDFLLGATAAGITSFSSMEIKGRDDPLDTANFAIYPDFKEQSENIRLVNRSGGKIALHRNILSVVAVRPTLATASNRELKCRWFNQAQEVPPSPPGLLATIACTQYAFLIWRLFGVWIRVPFFTLDFRIDRNFVPVKYLADLAQLVPIDDGLILPNTKNDHSPWRPFISWNALQLLKILERRPLPATGRQGMIELDAQIANFLEDQPLLRREDGPMLRMGIGLKFMG